MRALCDMDTIQIEITNACTRACSNCTRFVGHRKPYFMPESMFREAIDSMKGYPKMTGFMGGEPLLHPQFEEFCEYAREKIPREQLGLWTCLPHGRESYGELITKTFGNIFINDHSRDDILHAPLLVGVEEIFKDPREMFYVVDHCWVQNSWSAAINPNGAFFCEIAASMSLLFDEKGGWPVEEGWWWRTPKDFKEQIEQYCPRCGAAVPLPRRSSNDPVDDISEKNLERLKGISKRVESGKYQKSDLTLVQNPGEMAKYKDHNWRQKIADRYNIRLEVNEKGFHEPFYSTVKCARKSIFDEYQKRWKER